MKVGARSRSGTGAATGATPRGTTGGVRAGVLGNLGGAAADGDGAGSAGPLFGGPLTSTSTGLFGSNRLPGGANCSRTVSRGALSSIAWTFPNRSPTASNARAAVATGSPRRRGTTPEPWLAVTWTMEPIASLLPGEGFCTRTIPIGASGCWADRFTIKPKWRGTIKRAASATVMPTRPGTGGWCRSQASRSAEPTMAAAAAASVVKTAITAVRPRTRTSGRPPPRARPEAKDLATVDS